MEKRIAVVRPLPKRVGQGMTLIELLIAIVIVGLLASIAVPSYNEFIWRGLRSVGNAELLKVLARQEQFYLNTKQYATNLTALGYSANPYYVNREGESTTSGKSIYKIELASGATTSAFTLEADPQNGQTSDTICGKLTLSNTGVKGENGSGEVSDCW